MERTLAYKRPFFQCRRKKKIAFEASKSVLGRKKQLFNEQEPRLLNLALSHGDSDDAGTDGTETGQTQGGKFFFEDQQTVK